ncbi:MAG TPA: hypothetical protein VM307_07770, partial [Egibacteraceae bacterium]|nr:hypothetical protein [Egibacteraceae bacterium]
MLRPPRPPRVDVREDRAAVRVGRVVAGRSPRVGVGEAVSSPRLPPPSSPSARTLTSSSLPA